MTTNKDDPKIGGIQGTKSTTSVEGADAVGGVAGIKPTTGVGGVSGAAGVGRRRPTRTMSFEEREQLFRMIDEEADRLFEQSGMPEEKRQVVKHAVRMAVDAGIIDETATKPKK